MSVKVFSKFRQSTAGAVTAEWVVLSAGMAAISLGLLMVLEASVSNAVAHTSPARTADLVAIPGVRETGAPMGTARAANLIALQGSEPTGPVSGVAARADTTRPPVATAATVPGAAANASGAGASGPAGGRMSGGSARSGSAGSGRGGGGVLSGGGATGG